MWNLYCNCRSVYMWTNVSVTVDSQRAAGTWGSSCEWGCRERSRWQDRWQEDGGSYSLSESTLLQRCWEERNREEEESGVLKSSFRVTAVCSVLFVSLSPLPIFVSSSPSFLSSTYLLFLPSLLSNHFLLHFPCFLFLFFLIFSLCSFLSLSYSLSFPCFPSCFLFSV